MNSRSKKVWPRLARFVYVMYVRYPAIGKSGWARRSVYGKFMTRAVVDHERRAFLKRQPACMALVVRYGRC